MKYMKIEINGQQPLDDVVRELERLGFVPCMQPYWSGKWLATNKNTYAVFCEVLWSDWEIVTLAELRLMSAEQLSGVIA